MRSLAIPGRMTIGLMIRSDSRSFVVRFDAGPGGLKFQTRVYSVGDTGAVYYHVKKCQQSGHALSKFSTPYSNQKRSGKKNPRAKQGQMYACKPVCFTVV